MNRPTEAWIEQHQAKVHGKPKPKGGPRSQLEGDE